MKITRITTTPLLVPYKKPYHWAKGIIRGAGVVLVEVHTDDGLVGIGECVATPSAPAIEAYLNVAGDICIGRSPFENTRLMGECYHALFQALGTCSAPRYSGQVLAGLEMALWDVMGKATGRAVHELLGGAVRDEIHYFGFPQGATAQEVADEAREMAAAGCDVIYFKVGRGDALDLEIARLVRAAVGPDKRLRMDPNESWSPVRAARMLRKMSEFDIDMVEQPTNAESIAALAQVRDRSPIAIAADQLVFTPQDAYDVCREKAADMITLGLHETGGIARFRKVAHIAEAAGIDICLHGLYETGITTTAANQVGATLPNLDDGNQYMNHLLEWDIVKSPDLRLQEGRLPILRGPGLGIELDADALARAAEGHIKEVEKNG
ncbi:mandelate racemase/muconate lactonizing enzyme family protein [uncultured Boseongicola sp.]|uniref:mandelate racemase/muconate lactonizing enzyme family protein n=1 Tax=uncultured Boseongicola sp. TaxID=1648499 RepID=UPI0026300AD6|nr:mandelate racemase/muconate lactonizing enzyme family protein [uncultured Boseongicola sp.]